MQNISGSEQRTFFFFCLLALVTQPSKIVVDNVQRSAAGVSLPQNKPLEELTAMLVIVRHLATAGEKNAVRFFASGERLSVRRVDLVNRFWELC